MDADKQTFKGDLCTAIFLWLIQLPDSGLPDNGTGGGAYGVLRRSGAATALSHNPAGLMIPTTLQERCRASLATAVPIHALQAVFTNNLNASALENCLPDLTGR